MVDVNMISMTAVQTENPPARGVIAEDGPGLWPLALVSSVPSNLDNQGEITGFGDAGRPLLSTDFLSDNLLLLQPNAPVLHLPRTQGFGNC